MALEVVHKEMIADGKVISYCFESLGAEAAEEWFADVRDTFIDWESDAPLLMLLDFRKAETNLLSPDAMSLGHQISEIERDGKTAFIVDKSKPALNVLIQYIDKALVSDRAREIFETEQDAVKWLLSD